MSANSTLDFHPGHLFGTHFSFQSYAKVFVIQVPPQIIAGQKWLLCVGIGQAGRAISLCLGRGPMGDIQRLTSDLSLCSSYPGSSDC